MEDYVLPLTLLLLSIAAIASVISKLLHKRVPQINLPPGPKPWPVIGNLHLIGSIPHQSLNVLSQKYGGIMRLKFGMRPVVVVSSPDMAKQFLKVHDATFASRPLLAVGKYTSYNYSDMGWSPYGPYWRQARKIYFNEVFSARKLESFNHILVKETRTFLSRLRSVSGEPIILRDHLFRYTLSSISRITLGDIYVCESAESVDDNFMSKLDELRELLDEWFVLGGAFNIGDWIPWLAALDLQGYVKRMKAFAKKSDKFLDYVISDHLAKKASKKDFTGRDFVDALLDMTELDSKLQVKLTTERVKALVQNLLAAGTDTSAAAVEWAVIEMLRQPLVMKKAKEELDRVVGRNRWVEESDFSKLAYIDAIAMESMRLHPLATLLAPHYATENCNVAGYDVSKGTTVLINAWSLGRDPKSWDRPEEFLPERFLGKDIDVFGSNFAFLPFGSGRRRCPGYSLGLKTVRMALANLLHGFDLKLVEGMKPEDISFEESYGLTTHPKESLAIVMEPLLPAHLY